MFRIRARHNIDHQRGPRMKRHARLGLIFNGPLPTVNGSDRRDMLSTCDQPILDKASRKARQPINLTSRDNNLADIIIRHQPGLPFSLAGSIT